MIKDYYNILQIPPHADLQEIKQAYRKLAMQHHPDKNENDLYSAAQFNEIKEAYEVLTDPGKKEKYLQQRWYNNSIGQKKTLQAITPVNLLRQCLELEKYVSKLDVHRMNHEGLYEYMNELLSNDAIDALKKFADPAINRQVITTTLAAAKPLKYQFVLPLLTRLEKLAGGDQKALEQLRQYHQHRRKKLFVEKYKILFIVIATILICLLIFITSK